MALPRKRSGAATGRGDRPSRLKPERVQGRAGRDAPVDLIFRVADVGRLDDEGAVELELRGPTEVHGFLVLSDGKRAPTTALVEVLRLRLPAAALNDALRTGEERNRR